MVRTAVIDDEPFERETLRSFLARFAEESGTLIEVDQYPSGDALLSGYQLIYDMILLDVDMPGTNGIAAARKIREMDESVTILFITNMAQYAINAFEVEAADYILKPVEYYDFAMKFRRAVKRAARRGSRELTLDAADGVHRVNISDIVYVEALDHYLTYHLCEKGGGQTELQLRGSIGEQETLLTPYGFCRVHKSFLVNLSRVQVIRANEVAVGEAVLPVGRRYKKELMDRYLHFVR